MTPAGVRAGLDWTEAQTSDSSVEKGRKSTCRKFKLSNKNMFYIKKDLFGFILPLVF